MDLRDIDITGVQDVSVELGEENPANRLYLLITGQVVKAKTYEKPRAALMPASDRVFEITTSLTDEDGAALPGTISAVHVQTTRLRVDGPSHGEQLDHTRRQLAVWAETALAYMDEEIPGVAPGG